MVRRALTLMVGLLTAVAVCAAAGPPAATDAQNGGTIVPGSALAGIPLGGPIGSIISRFGPANQVRVGQDGTLAYVFDQYGITAYVVRDVIVAITTTNSLLAGVRGIYLGAPMPTVVQTFGGNYTQGVIEGFRGVLYPAMGLGFGFDQGGVAIVMVFSALALPQRDPTSPTSPAVTTGMAPAPTGSSPVSTGKGSAPSASSPVPNESAPAVTIGAAPTGATDASDARLGLGIAGAGITTIPGVSRASGLPDVRHLRAFAAETNYLSLAGYLRYAVYSMTGAWISPVESERFILQGESLPAP